MKKKIYSNRFNSACYSNFFRDQALASDVALHDFPTFTGVTATVDELKSMHSYFIDDLTGEGVISQKIKELSEEKNAKKEKQNIKVKKVGINKGSIIEELTRKGYTLTEIQSYLDNLR